jgi:hypothetical protein
LLEQPALGGRLRCRRSKHTPVSSGLFIFDSPRWTTPEAYFCLEANHFLGSYAVGIQQALSSARINAIHLTASLPAGARPLVSTLA